MDYDELPDDELNGESNTQRRHRHHRQSPKRRWLLSPLWIAIGVEAIIIAGLLIWGTLLEEDYSTSSEREKTLQDKLNQVQTELESLKYDVTEKQSAEQDSCMPRTVALKLEEFLDVNKGYVKRAFFVAAGKKGKKVLEYKVILRNDSKINLVPKFDIVFFNAAGNEVGTARFGYSEDGTSFERELEKGEVRTVDGTFEINNMPQPELFMIRIVEE